MKQKKQLKLVVRVYNMGVKEYRSGWKCQDYKDIIMFFDGSPVCRTQNQDINNRVKNKLNIDAEP